MACVNPDGTLSESAQNLLNVIQTPLTPQEISQKIGQPLFRVRSSLREMVKAGLVREDMDRFVITAKGKEIS